VYDTASKDPFRATDIALKGFDRRYRNVTQESQACLMEI
jgi:hypothetical protein